MLPVPVWRQRAVCRDFEKLAVVDHPWHPARVRPAPLRVKRAFPRDRLIFGARACVDSAFTTVVAHAIDCRVVIDDGGVVDVANVVTLTLLAGGCSKAVVAPSEPW